MSVLVLIGRIFFVVLFLSSAVGHLTQAEGMAGYAQSKGVPAAKLAVLGSGVLQAVAGLSILLGVWADLGALLLVIFLVPTAILMHPFWKETDAQAKQTEMIQFNKDLALAGAALMLFAFFAHVCDLGLTITGPLFHLG
ncbi:putative membrane protein YphA (DoxX/SURF4 family) [Nocardia transvalensis]|uniref:Putative membrane protein YphA (DoxX/SURF4 family) n=1 Tax=Nocardia transvalensis TaxID=37333 RepID=A0A7W9PLP2_9NOCA|nr:DoxX family protein [Nocardia transvalensis]MBB5917768.1 putative membrane protein YphA (DoxX/SURF4 family) [Nocardia transvalensis]